MGIFDKLTKNVRGVLNSDQNLRAEIQADPDEMPTEVNSKDMERMFQLRQMNRLIQVVDSLNMDTLKQLFVNAQNGFLGELIDVYVQMEGADARLKGMLSSRRNAVSRTNHVVTSGEEGNGPADEARDLVKSNIEKLKWKEFIRSLMDGRIYGVGIFENIWQRSPQGTLYIDQIKQIDHTLIEQYTSGSNFQDRVRYGELVLRPDNLSPKRIFLDELPPYKLIKAYQTNRDGYHDLEGVMRPVARWYVLKVFNLRVWAQYAEVYGFPVPIVKVAKEDFKKSKAMIKSLLQSVGVNRYGIFFKNMEYEMQQANSSQSIDVFEKYIQMANTEVAIAILGQNLTSEVQGGSRASSETHFKVLQDLTKDDLEWSDELVNDQFVKPLVRVNFPNLPLDLYPKYISIIDRDVNLETLGRGLKAMSQVIDIPTKWVYEQAQIPQPKEGEDVISNDSDVALNALMGGSR